MLDIGTQGAYLLTTVTYKKTKGGRENENLHDRTKDERNGIYP